MSTEPKDTTAADAADTPVPALSGDELAHIKSIRATTRQLAQVGAVNPGVILDALMTNYVALAEAHPEYAAEAGRVALSGAVRLVSYAAAAGHPGTVH